MSEMVERVTAALAEKLNGDPSWMNDISILAIAAIKAMREPTDAMVAAYPPTHWTLELATGYSERHELLSGGPLAGWRTMIDAALTTSLGGAE